MQCCSRLLNYAVDHCHFGEFLTLPLLVFNILNDLKSRIAVCMFILNYLEVYGEGLKVTKLV